MEKNRKDDAQRQPEIPVEYFRTGYVIEMQCGRYFAGWDKGRVCCLPVEKARYFAQLKEAEQYVRSHLGFTGLRVHICRVCWTLVETETIETDWRFVKEKNGKEVKFSSYRDAADYQRENFLQKKSMVDIYAFPEKELYLAA